MDTGLYRQTDMHVYMWWHMWSGVYMHRFGWVGYTETRHSYTQMYMAVTRVHRHIMAGINVCVVYVCGIECAWYA